MPKHNHGGNTSEGGGHTHTGTAQEAGEHTHKAYLYGAGGGRGDFVGFANRVEKMRIKPYDSSMCDVDVKTSGAHNHTIAINSVDNHTHTINQEGGGQAHNIMQPYLSVYMWKRVA